MNAFPKALKRQDHIQEGANPASGTVLLACTIADDDDEPKSRVLVVRDGGTLAFGLDGDGVVSIDAGSDGVAYVLGENGTVARFDWRVASTDEGLASSLKRVVIPEVEELGPLRRIRLLGDDVVCAGSVGQAYRLDGEAFVALPQLLVDGNDLTIEDLAGTSASDIVVATSDGYVAHFDGQSWHKLDVPSSSGLSTICRLSDDRYAIAGDNGTLLVGAGRQWAVVPADAERDYYGVASDGATLYLAHIGGIDVSGGGTLKALAIPKRSKNEFAVLRSGPDGVWSTAGRCVGLITGGQWQTMA